MLSQSQAQPISLRRRLFFSGTLFLLLSMSVVGFVLDKAFAATTRSTIHERLENTVFLLLAVIQTDQDALGLNQLLPDERLERPGSGLYAGVLTEGMEWRSHSSLTENFYQASLLSAGQEHFDQDRDKSGRFLLSMGLEWENEDGSAFPMTVWAAQSRAEFDRQMLSYRRALWPWLGAVSALIMAVQGLGMWFGMRPLKQIEAQVKAVEAGEVDRLEGRYPVELKPLTDNVNALLATERGNRERYQKALGDLAHSLKTPLAILQQTLTEASLSHSLDQSELEHAHSAIVDMRATISRQLERAVAATRRTHAQPVLVASLVNRLSNVLSKVYQDRDIDISCALDQQAKFYGEERDFMEIAGNLMENACKYGNGRVRVEVDQLNEQSRRPGLRVLVEDNGPGMEDEQFIRLQRRGERGDEQQEGQGLGLGIVAELVHAYDAQIQLRASSLGGAAILVEFPAL